HRCEFLVCRRGSQAAQDLQQQSRGEDAAFAKHGARVAILDLDEAGAQRAAKELGEGHIGVACDVTDLESCKRAARQVLDAFGQLEALIKNARLSATVTTV